MLFNLNVYAQVFDQNQLCFKNKKWTDHFLPLAKWEAGLRETMRIATTAASVGIIDVHYLLASTADS